MSARSSFDLVIQPYLVEVPTTFARGDRQGEHHAEQHLRVAHSRHGRRRGTRRRCPVPRPSVYVAPGADRQDPAVRQRSRAGRRCSSTPVADTLTTVLGGTGTLTGSSGEPASLRRCSRAAVRVHLTSTAPAATDLHLSLGGWCQPTLDRWCAVRPPRGTWWRLPRPGQCHPALRPRRRLRRRYLPAPWSSSSRTGPGHVAPSRLATPGPWRSRSATSPPATSGSSKPL